MGLANTLTAPLPGCMAPLPWALGHRCLGYPAMFILALVGGIFWPWPSWPWPCMTHARRIVPVEA